MRSVARAMWCGLETFSKMMLVLLARRRAITAGYVIGQNGKRPRERGSWGAS